MRCNPVIAVMFLVLGWGSTAEHGMAQIGESSLEDLLNIEITTASKFAEPLWEAPGVVTVITSKEIEQFGADSIWEALAMVPGIQPLYSYQASKGVAPIRGDLPTISDNHVLILINGRPGAGRHSWDGGGNSTIHTAFPIHMVDRIEVVRGPGSVLYGTNAFTGVINIITKKSDDTQLMVEARGGDFDAKSVSVNASFVKGDLRFSGGISFLDEDGWNYDLFREDGSFFDGNAFAETFGFFSTLQYKGFTLSTYFARSELFMLSAADSHKLDYPNRFVDLGYETELSNRWRLQANVSWSSWDYRIIPDHFPPESTIHLSSDDYLGEVTLFGQLDDKTNVLFGFVGNRLTGETPPPNVIANAWTYFWWSSYAQIEYQPVDSVKLIGGFQYNDAEENDDFVPRVGSIINFNENAGVKLLYGEAFRSPYAAELDINTPVIAGNKDLVPQTVTTTDIQLFYSAERFQASLTYFDSQQENLIIFVPHPDPEISGLTTMNLNEVDSKGFEFESKYIPSHNWYLSLSYNTQKTENGFGVEDVTLAPDGIFKLGVGYTGELISAGLFENYLDEYKDNVINSPTRIVRNPKSEAVHLVNAQVALNFSDLDFRFTDISVELRATNLLDEELWVPETFNQLLNTIPGTGERGFHLSIRARY